MYLGIYIFKYIFKIDSHINPQVIQYFKVGLQ